MVVLRKDRALRALQKPALVELSDLTLGQSDVLVACGGFEERSTAVLKRAVASGSRRFHVVCVRYDPEEAANRLGEIQHLCAVAEASHVCVTYSRWNPDGGAEQVLDAIGEDARIHIDISGMSRLLIVQLISAIVSRRVNAQVLYTEAEEYPPTQSDVSALGDALLEPDSEIASYLSHGVYGLTVVPELSSSTMQGQPMRLIIFPSWNPMQLASVCSELQAFSYKVIHGRPPRADLEWRTRALRELNRIARLSPRDESYASTLDYRESLNILLDEYDAHSALDRLVIVPTGSKMQTLAVGVACGWLPDLQIVYPTPKTFRTPETYTIGSGPIHVLSTTELIERPAPD